MPSPNSALGRWSTTRCGGSSNPYDRRYLPARNDHGDNAAGHRLGVNWSNLRRSIVAIAADGVLRASARDVDDVLGVWMGTGVGGAGTRRSTLQRVTRRSRRDRPCRGAARRRVVQLLTSRVRRGLRRPSIDDRDGRGRTSDRPSPVHRHLLGAISRPLASRVPRRHRSRRHHPHTGSASDTTRPFGDLAAHRSAMMQPADPLCGATGW